MTTSRATAPTIRGVGGRVGAGVPVAACGRWRGGAGGLELGASSSFAPVHRMRRDGFRSSKTKAFCSGAVGEGSGCNGGGAAAAGGAAWRGGLGRGALGLEMGTEGARTAGALSTASNSASVARFAGSTRRQLRAMVAYGSGTNWGTVG